MIVLHIFSFLFATDLLLNKRDCTMMASTVVGYLGSRYSRLYLGSRYSRYCSSFTGVPSCGNDGSLSEPYNIVWLGS